MPLTEYAKGMLDARIDESDIIRTPKTKREKFNDWFLALPPAEKAVAWETLCRLGYAKGDTDA